MPTYFAAFKDAHDAEQAVSELLDKGVPPEKISLVLDEEYASRIVSFDEDGPPLYLEDDLTISPPGDRSVDVRQARDPMTWPARDIAGRSDFIESDRPLLHESPIGGGISTATPDDDVSGIEEMDDGQSVAEDLLYPDGPVDQRHEDVGEIEESDPEYMSRTDITDTTLGIKTPGAVKGQEFGMGAGVLAALSSFDVPGVGVVLGDGELATQMADAGALPVAGGILGHLEAVGVPGDVAGHYTAAFEVGGGLLSVDVPSGDIGEKETEEILGRFRAMDVRAFD